MSLIEEGGERLRAATRLLARRSRAHTHPATYQQSGPKRSQEAPGRNTEHRGLFAVTSISFLPTTFTTLFVLAASLLLGYV